MIAMSLSAEAINHFVDLRVVLGKRRAVKVGALVTLGARAVREVHAEVTFIAAA